MQKKLEHYLNEIRAQLKALPLEQREAEIREIRQHLETLVADYVSEGLSEEDALAQAIDQFGSPKKNGRALRRTWLRANSRRGNQWLNASYVLMCVLLVLIVASSSLRAFIVSPVFGPTVSLSAITSQHQRESQLVHARWDADNLAIWRMDTRDETAVSRAQGEAMVRFQTTSNACNARWQTNIKVFQCQQLASDLLAIFAFGLLLSLLLLGLMRSLVSRESRRMTVR